MIKVLVPFLGATLGPLVFLTWSGFLWWLGEVLKESLGANMGRGGRFEAWTNDCSHGGLKRHRQQIEEAIMAV